jgi:chromosome segregation ATPase
MTTTTTDRSRFGSTVEAELRRWDLFLERLQAAAATKTGRAREQAEAAISELRQRRLAVSERLAQMRDSSGAAWDEHKQKLAAAREELQRKADELSTNLH